MIDKLKIAWNQKVDLIILLITIIFFVLYAIDSSRNYTGYLFIMIGYIINNILNKVIYISKLPKE